MFKTSFGNFFLILFGSTMDNITKFNSASAYYNYESIELEVYSNAKQLIVFVSFDLYPKKIRVEIQLFLFSFQQVQVNSLII